MLRLKSSRKRHRVMKSISCAVYEDFRFLDMFLTLYCQQGSNDTKYISIKREFSGADGSDTALQDGG